MSRAGLFLAVQQFTQNAAAAGLPAKQATQQTLILSGEAALWDSHAQSQREEGATAADAPLFSDAWVQGAKEMLPNPFSDPDAWTPRGPAQ
jgi:hypothetical protein